MAVQEAARQEPPPTAIGGIIAFASTFCKGVERYLNPAAVLALAVGLPARCVVPYASVLACPFSTPVRVIFLHWPNETIQLNTKQQSKHMSESATKHETISDACSPDSE